MAIPYIQYRKEATMRFLACIAAAVAAFSSFAGFNEALDVDGLTFTTGGDAEWFEQSDVAKTGETALRSGAISADEDTWIETTVAKTGMLSFWWRVSSESVSYDWLEVAVDGDVKDKVGGEDPDWYRKSFVVTAGQTVRWRYRKDGSYDGGEDCGWLDGVEFEAAPDKMTITFETNGGEALDAAEVVPGATYSSLPTPARDGNFVFDGW